MKILKKLLFISAAMFCFSAAASAQQPSKTPIPKPSPPKIIVQPKEDDRPKDRPKDGNKKPNAEIFDFTRRFI